MKALLKITIYQPLFNLLVFLIWLMPGNSLALAIVALTLIIRVIFLPSLLKQGVSQEKLRYLQPKIKELQKTHKEDKAAQSRAMIDLYKQAGTSPWGSCLPIIIQLIVLIILYRVFQDGLTTSRFDLLYSFIPHPKAININLFGIDISKPELWFLPIIAGLAQFVQSKIALPKIEKKSTADPMALASSQMVYLIPVMTIYIARQLPAALAVYWITTSIFMIGQQLYINKVLKPKVQDEMAAITNKITAAEPVAKARDDQKQIAGGKGVSVTIRQKKRQI